MLNRQAFIVAALMVAIPAALAKRAASAAPPADQKTEQRVAVHLTIEVRRLIGAANLNERIGITGMKPLPAYNSFSVRNDWSNVLNVFAADLRDNKSAIEHPEKISLGSADKQAWSPLGPGLNISESDTIRAVYLPGQNAFQFQLAWTSHRAGEEPLRAMTAVVPSGHHLLIHTGSHFKVYQTLAEVGVVEYCLNSLFTRPQRMQLAQQLVDDYLLLTPRLSGPVE